MEIISAYNNLKTFCGQKSQGVNQTTIPVRGGKIGQLGNDVFVSSYSKQDEMAAQERFDHLVNYTYNYARGIEDFTGEEKEYLESKSPQKKIARINEWTKFLTRPKAGIRYPERLKIFESVVQNVRYNDSSGPLRLDQDKVMTVLGRYRKAEDKDAFDFHTEYQNELRKPFMADIPSSGDAWMVIPSKVNDSKNYKSNLRKLNIMSAEHWDTSSYDADNYLRDSDFHILFRDGKPIVGMSVSSDGVSNMILGNTAGKVPVSAFDTICEYADSNNFDYSPEVKNQLELAENSLEYLYGIYGDNEGPSIKEILEEEDELSSNGGYSVEKTEKLLTAMGMSCKPDGNGHLVVASYTLPTELRGECEEVGLDENKLFKNISMIKDKADFTDSTVTDLGILKQVGGDAIFRNSKLETLGNLEKINGNAYFEYSNIKSLGKLHTIGKNAIFCRSKLEDTGELRYVGGYLDYRDSELSSTCKIEYAHDVRFSMSNIRDAKSLKRVPGSISNNRSKIADKDLNHIKNQRNNPIQRLLRGIFS